MGASMNLHQVDNIDYGVFRSTRSQLRISSLDYVRKVKSSGRGFVMFGVLYCILEMAMHNFRPKSDGANHFMAGGLCSGLLVLDTGMGPKGIAGSFLFGGLIALVMEEFMEGRS